MKLCICCQEYKGHQEFSIANKLTGRRLSYCKQCRAKKGRKWYSQLSIQSRAQKVKAASQQARKKLFQRVKIYLDTHPCVDCGEADILVLEFDHVQSKTAAIGTLIGQTKCWETVMREIEKCEVRCANCHRRRHAKESNSWRNLLQDD